MEILFIETPFPSIKTSELTISPALTSSVPITWGEVADEASESNVALIISGPFAILTFTLSVSVAPLFVLSACISILSELLNIPPT